MKVRYLIAVCVILLAIVGMTLAQQPKPAVAPPPPVAGPLPPASLPPEPVNMLPPAVQPQPIPNHPAKPVPTTEGKPESMTIEQLMDAVDEFREQKAELDRKEKAYLKVMHRKAAKLKDRMDNISAGTTDPMMPIPIGIPQPLPSTGVPTRPTGLTPPGPDTAPSLGRNP